MINYMSNFSISSLNLSLMQHKQVVRGQVHSLKWHLSHAGDGLITSSLLLQARSDAVASL